MTDKQIIIDDLMKQLNEKTVAIMLLRETLDRKEQKIDHLKVQLLDQEAETLKAGRIIHKLEQTLTEIKEIIKFNKVNRLSGGADISIEQILQKISECEGNDENN